MSAQRKVSGQSIKIRAKIEERKQDVHILEQGDVIMLSSLVVHRSKTRLREDSQEFINQRNLKSLFVHFQFNEQNDLYGHACMPKAGHSAAELAFAVERVAVECDRMEYLLTGEDAN